MQHTLGKYTLNLSGWGKNKRSEKGEAIDFRAPNTEVPKGHNFSQICEEYEVPTFTPKLWMFGQDLVGILKHKDFLLTINADGHGGTAPHYIEGRIIAYYSGLFALLEIYKNIKHIMDIYTEEDELSRFMNSLYQRIDDKIMLDMPETRNIKTGGSTLTTNIKFIDELGNLVSLTTNCGDSLLVHFDVEFPYQYAVVEDTIELNCDTLEAYQLYVDKCNKLDTIPKEVFLGRFNFKNGFEIDWHENAYEPLRPFLLDRWTNGKYTAEENVHEMKQFYNYAPKSFYDANLMKGGTQSVRGRAGNIKQIEEGGYPSTNFGNTAEGICQCLPGSSIGDKTQKKLYTDMMLSQTTVRIYKHIKSETELIGSDGFFDPMADLELLDILDNSKPDKTQKAIDIELFKNLLIERMLANVKREEWKNSWDDVSMVIITIKKNKNKKQNKFAKKRENRTRRKNIRK